MKSLRLTDRLEIRLNDDGSLDEVLTYGPDGKLEFHLEQMDVGQWWMRFSSTEGRPLPADLVVNLGPNGMFEFDSSKEEEEKFSPELVELIRTHQEWHDREGK